MHRSKILALAPFVSFFAMFAYLFAIRALGDPRAQDLELKDGELRWFEGLWLGSFSGSNPRPGEKHTKFSAALCTQL